MYEPHEQAASQDGFQLTPQRPVLGARSIQTRACDCTSVYGKGRALDSKMATHSSLVDGSWGVSTWINLNRGLVVRWVTRLAPITSWNHVILVSKWAVSKWEGKMLRPFKPLSWYLYWPITSSNLDSCLPLGLGGLSWRLACGSVMWFVALRGDTTIRWNNPFFELRSLHQLHGPSLHVVGRGQAVHIQSTW
jgi:hypothetical protein